MGEIKSVKVDNWGVFFLQKLQNFFNKTDYCDLTLQFRDNSQLKVHRLVLSACTDYFNVLEQTCDMVDDALLMPDELQADVVVPIVNFMYTGTLEFELKMYGKLLRTAKEMNMTVLLKLLEAHRRTMEGVNRAQRPPSPKPIRRRPMPATTIPQQQTSPQQRRVLTSANVTQSPSQQRVAVQTKSIATNVSQLPAAYRQQIGSTSLLRTTAGGTTIIRQPFYGSTPAHSSSNQQQLQIKQEDQHVVSGRQQQPTSPFEQLRKGYNNTKRPAPTTFASPPAKKPNIEDVKEFAEQQRMRKQIAAEYGDDPEYEGMLDDDIHNDDDDDDGALASSTTAVTAAAVASTSKQSSQGGATVTFRQEINDKNSTIVVKDSSNKKMDHAKIISEVLRQYPHLVKGNKNIKLKIMPGVGQTQKIVVKKEQGDNAETCVTQQQQHNLPGAKVQTSVKPSDKIVTQKVTLHQSQTMPKESMTPAKTSTPVSTTLSGGKPAAANAGATPPTQKRRIDSKTMHALIALGAENVSGPWLCLRCGVNGRPISIPTYRGFRRHLINSHKEVIDAALCEHCGWRSTNNRELHFHMELDHKVRTTLYTFPECLMCAEQFLDTNALNKHMMDSHPDESKQKCIYCNKIFAKEIQLYTHMKTFHKAQALEDGIIDYSDDEFSATTAAIDTINTGTSAEKKETKIKILSDISLPSAGALLKLEPSSEAAALSTVASGIAASIGISHAEEFMDTQEAETATETQFLNADGNEVLLTAEERKEIMSHLNENDTANASGRILMVINENAAFGTAAESVTTADDNEGSVSESAAVIEGAANADNQMETSATAEGSATEEEYDDSQIFNELTSQTNASITEEEDDEDEKEDEEEEHDEEEEDANADKRNTSPAVDDSKESIDENLEWAEKLISAHEKAESAADEEKVKEDKAKKAEDISKKLKELTGDWSDDENDEDMEAETEAESILYADTSAEANMDTTKDDAINTSTPTSEEAKKIEESNTDVKHDDGEETAAVTAQEVVATDELSEDADDIDMAMQSLHKDEETIAEKSTSTAMNEATPKTKVDDQIMADTDVDVNKEEKEDEPKRSEIKTENESPISEGKAKDKSDADKSLLYDLIADTDLSGADDENEFLSGNSNATSPIKQEEEVVSTLEKDKDATTNEDDNKASDAAENENEMTAKDVKETSNTVKEIHDATTGNNGSDENSVSEELKTPEETAAADKSAEESTIEEGKSSETIATPAPAETVKAEDKVKSLISEWGDDEENDDEGNQHIAGDGADEL